MSIREIEVTFSRKELEEIISQEVIKDFPKHRVEKVIFDLASSGHARDNYTYQDFNKVRVKLVKDETFWS